MKKRVGAMCIAICLTAFIVADLCACTPKVNELVLERAAYTYRIGGWVRWVDFTYRTTSKKEYDVKVVTLNEDNTIKGEKILVEDAVGWDKATEIDGIREVPIIIYLLADKDTDIGKLRITIKDGKKVILEQIFDYECVEIEE